MTATTLTYLAAQGHINGLCREAERHRRTAGVTAPKRVRRGFRACSRAAPRVS